MAPSVNDYQIQNIGGFVLLPTIITPAAQPIVYATNPEYNSFAVQSNGLQTQIIPLNTTNYINNSTNNSSSPTSVMLQSNHGITNTSYSRMHLNLLCASKFVNESVFFCIPQQQFLM